MRRIVIALAAAATVAAMYSAPAEAGSPTPVQWVNPQGAAVTVQQGANGLPINDQDRDRNWVLLQPNALQTILQYKSACATVPVSDSTGMFPTKGCTRLRLRVRVTFPTAALCGYTPSKTTWDSVFAATFAIQPRMSTVAAFDSTGSAVMAEWKRSSAIGTADSAGSLTEVAGALPNVDNPEPGEFIFVWPNQSGVGTVNNPVYKQNYTRIVDLVSRDGSPIVSEYIGFRVRPMKMWLDISGVATLAADGAQSKPLFFVMDLLGSR